MNDTRQRCSLLPRTMGRLWLCLALGVADAARAADGAPSLLADAVGAAWQRAVAARQAESGVAVADAEARAARMWSADTPSFEVLNRTGDWGNAPGVRETEVGVAWPVWLPGQRSAGIDAARVGVSVAAAAERAERLRIAGEVREALWDLQVLAAERSGALRVVEYSGALAADTERRAAAGDAARIEALAARAELHAAEAAAAEAETAADDAERRWTLLTGLPVPANAPGIEAVGSVGDPSADEASVDAHPDVRLATLRAEHARAQARFARRTPTGTPEVRVAIREDVAGGGEPSERSVVIGASVPFGGGARRERIDATAAGELSAATAAERLARDGQRAALATARRAFAAAQRQAAAEDARRALVLERLEFVERSHRAGETSLAELLQERVAAAQAEADAARRRAGLGLAAARVRQALGALP